MKGTICIVSMTTGNRRRSHRNEVDDQSVEQLRASIDCAIEADDAKADKRAIPLPDLPEHNLTARRSGECLIVTVSHGDMPIVTIGVARHARCGADAWNALSKWGGDTIVTDDTPCPLAPWAASLLEPAALRGSALSWLDSIECCLAWAWIGER